jgi:transcriptional regulator with XRE-family HTH domain
MSDSRPLTVLKNFRASRGLTQADLGRELGGLSDVTISRWETGERRIDDGLVPKVAEYTGIPRAELRPDLAALLEHPEAAE